MIKKYILIIILFFSKTILFSSEKKYTLFSVVKPHPETTLAAMSNIIVSLTQDYTNNSEIFPSTETMSNIFWSSILMYLTGLTLRARKYIKQKQTEKKKIKEGEKQLEEGLLQDYLDNEKYIKTEENHGYLIIDQTNKSEIHTGPMKILSNHNKQDEFSFKKKNPKCQFIELNKAEESFILLPHPLHKDEKSTQSEEQSMIINNKLLEKNDSSLFKKELINNRYSINMDEDNYEEGAY